MESDGGGMEGWKMRGRGRGVVGSDGGGRGGNGGD